jgi:peptidoglycan-associated lipoprotein
MARRGSAWTFKLVVWVALLVAGAAACGKKRPPLVRTGAPGGQAERGTTEPARGGAPETVDPGPDVSAMREEGASAEDFAVSDPSGEGGPLADIYFEFDQASLTDEARATLEKHALWLQNHRDARIIVEGHCDERGTVEYNLALGDRRAQTALEYLVSLGVAAERLRPVSYGKERPIVTGSGEASWSKNRRAHFAVSR